MSESASKISAFGQYTRSVQKVAALNFSAETNVMESDYRRESEEYFHVHAYIFSGHSQPENGGA